MTHCSCRLFGRGSLPKGRNKVMGFDARFSRRLNILFYIIYIIILYVIFCSILYFYFYEIRLGLTRLSLVMGQRGFVSHERVDCREEEEGESQKASPKGRLGSQKICINDIFQVFTSVRGELWSITGQNPSVSKSNRLCLFVVFRLSVIQSRHIP